MTEDADTTDTQDERLHVRVSPERLKRWRAAAEREERSLSNWLRLAADDRVKKSMELAPRRPKKKRRPKR